MTDSNATPAEATGRDAALEAAYGKVFRHIVPFLMFCYFVAYLDRVNVGFAKLQMAKELNISDFAYGLGAGIFFIGYFFFEVPSNLIMHRIGARIWIARIMITWGLISGAFMFVNSEMSFYILRFLLGAAEAGFFPGIILYMTYWFPSHRRAKIITTFMAAIPVSAIFGNPISGWIMDTFHGAWGFQGWQWMFVLEAIPSVIMGVLTLIYLRDGIRDAHWLTENEKTMLEAEIAKENAQKQESPSHLRDVLTNSRVWLMCFIYFCFVLGQYGLNFWLPTLVKATGVQGNFNIGLLSAIPYIVTFVAMIALGRSSDAMRERRWHLVVPALVGAAGFIFITMTNNTTLAIGALSLAAAGVLSCAPLFWALPTSFLAGVGAAAGIAWINSVGNLAGYMGPFLVGWLRDATQSNTIGMYVLAAALVAGAVAVLTVPAKSVNK